MINCYFPLQFDWPILPEQLAHFTWNGSCKKSRHIWCFKNCRA